MNPKEARLSKLRDICLMCRECDLCKTRTKLVFGDGFADARVMFIGEAPGRDEDLQGVPFVGRSGQLLRKMIQVIGLKQEDFYIANILKDRPPNNRTPSQDEIGKCIRFLHKQIEIIQPKLLVLLGKTAVNGILPEHKKMSMAELRLRSEGLAFQGVPVRVTYHPSALLRNPNWKPLAAEDFKALHLYCQKL